ncbi:MAG TPA: hypothetical protein PKC54_15200 [Ferruginibacter sp.]|nr:hypothetical protein [Ferruginibacter sp.]
MKTRSNRIVILSLVILFAACKKQELQKENGALISAASRNAKSWLESQTTSAGHQNFLMDQKLIEVPQKILWHETKEFPGTRTSITPVSFTSVAGTLPVSKYLVTETDDAGRVQRGDYYFVLTEKKGQSPPPELVITPELFNSKTVPEDFKGAIIKYDLNNNKVLSKHYEGGVLTGKDDNLVVRKSKNQVPVENTAPLPEGCSYITIDWYWQTWVNGVLVYEEYLYSSNVMYCEGGGNGGGSGGGDPAALCNQQFNALINSASTASISEGKTLLYETNDERAHTYKWKCLTSPGGWFVRSYDIGVQERGPATNYAWHWKSITHSDISVIGITIGGGVEKDGAGTGTVTLMGNINAHYTLDFSMKYTPGCSFLSLPPYKIDYTSSTIFSVYPYAGGPQ